MSEWRPSDPKQDPLRLYMVNDAGERLSVQPEEHTTEELEELELAELDYLYESY